MISSKLHQIIKKQRKELGMTQEVLSSKANVGYPWLIKFETGKIKKPGFFKIARLAIALKASLDDYIFWIPELERREGRVYANSNATPSSNNLEGTFEGRVMGILRKFTYS